MHTPDHFVETDQAVIHGLIDDAPFASVVAQAAEAGIVVNHLPLLRQQDNAGAMVLSGHVARANPLWTVGDGVDCLALFHGPQAYISPNWYPSKQIHHRVVPTWNYQAVHVHGRMQCFDDPARLRRIVHDLTSKFEGATNPDGPWAIGDAPADFVEQMIANIIGIEIIVTGIEAKSKLSQNRPEADRLAVIDALDKQGNDALATAMRAKEKGRS